MCIKKGNKMFVLKYVYKTCIKMCIGYKFYRYLEKKNVVIRKLNFKLSINSR